MKREKDQAIVNK